MKKLFLHIGPHKTGSTSIQRSLIDNRYELNNHGIVYPEIGFHYMGHHKLAEALLNDNFTKAKLIIEDINSIDSSVVISSENFDLLNTKQVEFLKENLNYDQVKVIYVYRNTAEKLVSSWQESIKHGGMDLFSEFMCEHLSRPFMSEVLNDKSILDRYSSCFGESNLNVLILQKNRNLIDDFYKCLGIDISIENLKVNVSANYLIIELLRQLNVEKFKRDGTVDVELRESLFNYISNTPGFIDLVVDNIEFSSYTKFRLDNIFIVNHFQEELKNKYIKFHDYSEEVKYEYDLPSSKFKFNSVFIEEIYGIITESME
ncbi:hypothetical protein ST37_04190 [Vibrio sp. qd031]|uniref:hypothetical protein n=1 Tax=Vibrio sp. qd031 TaxID=1603038 RepID=UPI000A0FFFF2|nr:hypothetical protein [Vibrio sp. qd031]ORT51886.1 hypothetical protein ST37_04190 [Vibrio sp. qd031]